ncbi:hypothetical protein KFE25_012139 [Diacronema lutheri]|uniref:Calcineurin-like phosphoesterase domain-containing protein n=1 Tax=Diacronema lutheri TaxID=2081491 RepID=A0A8J5XKN6_DIALT|nr:hypothetical protein KFE25_012139 [Diacronema lutheri]
MGAAIVWILLLAVCVLPAPSGGTAAQRSVRSALELRLPSRAPPLAGERTVYAVGDVHGDGRALRRLLAAAGVTDAAGRWAAGDAVLVQTGDLFDRHADDLEPLRLLRRLRRGARERGGEVCWLMGNHEALNMLGVLDYVPDGGFAPFDRLMRRWHIAIDAGFAALDPSDAAAATAPHERARRVAMAPGGIVARALAAPIALIVGETLFAHAGVRAAHVPLLAAWNAQAVAWARGDGAWPRAALSGVDSPVWTRVLSGDPDYDELGSGLPHEVCAELDDVLRATGCSRLVVGHTPQPRGVNCACANRVWRVDVGMSDVYGGPAELLRIDGSSGACAVFALPRGGACGEWLPASARTAPSHTPRRPAHARLAKYFGGPKPPLSVGADGVGAGVVGGNSAGD